MKHALSKVVVPAAGLGTRFLPATKAVPKEMLPIVDTPTIQLIVFPESLSCRDTRTAMTCNQDFGLGEFKLAPSGSHGS